MSGLSLLERSLLFYGTRCPNHPRKWWLHGQLRRMLGVSIDREIDVVRNGIRLSLNPADFEHQDLFWLGNKDRWDLHHLRRLLRPGMTIFDVGANLGYYALSLALACHRQCLVHAFEPNPATYERLVRHIQRNDLCDMVKASRIALSDQQTTATLIERPGNSGASRIGDDAPGISVEVTTLDAFCDDAAIDSLDLLKIDVEGLEPKVLLGGQKTITRSKPVIVVEFWTTGLERAHSNVSELAGTLDRLGYQMFKPFRERLEPVTDPPHSSIPENVFCFHPDRPLSSWLLH